VFESGSELCTEAHLGQKVKGHAPADSCTHPQRESYPSCKSHSYRRAAAALHVTRPRPTWEQRAGGSLLGQRAQSLLLHPVIPDQAESQKIKKAVLCPCCFIVSLYSLYVCFLLLALIGLLAAWGSSALCVLLSFAAVGQCHADYHIGTSDTSADIFWTWAAR